MPFTTAGLNNMVQALGATHAAIFEGDPSGAGTQLGDRQAISKTASGDGETDISAAAEFPVLSGQTVTHAAFYDAATGGTLLQWESVTDEAFGEDGTYRLTEGVSRVQNPA
jgi:hypothetical protein